MWSYLKGHPEIFMSSEKELYFFDADLRTDPATTPSLEEYLRHFSAARDEKKIGEATPSYLRSPGAPKAIKDFSPTAQIIIMLRNPVDVMHSLHSGALYGLEPVTDFEAALAADATRAGRDRIGYRDLTDFPEQVRRYLDLFGRDNVHVIIYDDLRDDSVAVYQDTLRFLRVHLGFTPQFVILGANERVRNIRLQRTLARPPRALRHLSALVPSRLRSRIRRALFNCNLEVRPRPPMDLELRRRLQREFEPKVAQLGNLLGRDLSAWYKDSNGEGGGRK
jgi:hypothetical protein